MDGMLTAARNRGQSCDVALISRLMYWSMVSAGGICVAGMIAEHPHGQKKRVQHEPAFFSKR
jgi:hypothetical protein